MLSKTFKHCFLIIGMGCLIGTFFVEHTFADESQNKSEWIMVWSDEFEGDVIDPQKWRVEDAALIKNNELQYYTPEDVYLEDGTLVLRSRKNSMGGRDYTSGLIETKGLFTQTYGFFEIRAKVPKGKGIWPAHWMLNAVGTWPPEIDIMELLGHRPEKVHMTNHFGIHPNNSSEGSFFVGSDFSEGFHTFGVDWSPDSLRWYIDGDEQFSTRKNIPNVPFYIILNTAVGGDWPGKPNSTTPFPQYHFIDYVRVYKRNIPGTAFIVASAKQGKIVWNSKKERYTVGENVELRAEPDIGYKFESWEGDIQSADNPLHIIIKDNLIIEAVFVKDPDGPSLISTGKDVKASSMENAELQASNIVDGNLATRWSSKFSDPQWVRIDLGQSYQIDAVKLYWEAAHGKRYEIQISDDDHDWKTVKSIDDFVGQVQNVWLANVSGRYIRLMGTERATEWGYSLWEIEVFGKSSFSN